VVLYTDGVTEALNEAGEEFGSARLMAVVRAQSGSSARELIVQIRDAIRVFTGNQPQFDDITLMVLKAK
jgi:sigma-B regulation protein RsbU (phosphoserine phosphatase)